MIVFRLTHWTCSWSWGLTAITKCVAFPVLPVDMESSTLVSQLLFLFPSPPHWHISQYSIPVILNTWPLDWQYHPGNCYKFLVPRSDLLNQKLRVGPSNLCCCNGSPRWLWYSLAFENHYLSYSVKINLPRNQFSKWPTYWKSVLPLDDSMSNGNSNIKKWKLAKLNKCMDLTFPQQISPH